MVPPASKLHLESIPRLIQINIKPSAHIRRNRLQFRQHTEEIRRNVKIAEIRDRKTHRRRILASTATAAAGPVGLDTAQAVAVVAFVVSWVLVLPCGGCGGATSGHVVRAVEVAGNEICVEALEFAVD
jgi:hypothetical protein